MTLKYFILSSEDLSILDQEYVYVYEYAYVIEVLHFD